MILWAPPKGLGRVSDSALCSICIFSYRLWLVPLHCCCCSLWPSHGATQCQILSDLHDPFKYSKPALPEWLVHYQVQLPAQDTTMPPLHSSFCVLTLENIFQKISPQQCCSLLNQSWFFSTIWPDTTDPSHKWRSRGLLPFEMWWARLLLSARLSVFLPSRLPQHRLLSSRYSMAFLSPSTVLPQITWSGLLQKHPTPGTNFYLS